MAAKLVMSTKQVQSSVDSQQVTDSGWECIGDSGSQWVEVGRVLLSFKVVSLTTTWREAAWQVDGWLSWKLPWSESLAQQVGTYFSERHRVSPGKSQLSTNHFPVLYRSHVTAFLESDTSDTVILPAGGTYEKFQATKIRWFTPKLSYQLAGKAGFFSGMNYWQETILYTFAI